MEHFIYGSDFRLARFTASVLETCFEVEAVPGGVVVTGGQDQGPNGDFASILIERFALEHGLSYDGHRTSVSRDGSDQGIPLDI